MGYGYIAAAHAGAIDRFYRVDFNRYLNFHRPCGQPERVTDRHGKAKFVYQRYAVGDVARAGERNGNPGSPQTGTQP